MIEEQYITEDTAKMLFECGCKDARECMGKPEYGSQNRQVEYNYKGVLTQAQAMRWLRENKCVYIVTYVVSLKIPHHGSKIECVAKNFPFADYVFTFGTYEESQEETIQTACKHLLGHNK